MDRDLTQNERERLDRFVLAAMAALRLNTGICHEDDLDDAAAKALSLAKKLMRLVDSQGD